MLLEKELRAPSYKCRAMAMGTNTDPYQPAERHFKITRSILEVLQRFKHPIGFVTKSALITRDIDVLAPMAAENLARAAVSVTSLDPAEARKILYAYPDKARDLFKTPEVASANGKMSGRYNNGILVDEDLLARLPEIKARTLILMGSKEKMIPAKTGQVLKEKIRSSHLAYIYDAAHAIEVDQPERTLRIVKAFLERGESYIVNFGETAVA